MIKRSLHLVCFLLLVSVGAAPVRGAGPVSLTGVVRDSAGQPRIGAVVQLLRPDLSIIASVYTNSDGTFAFPTVMPGRYAVKAMGASFLPSLRENVRVRTSTIVNLTLNTLYEAMQWLPAERRTVDSERDDWAWTLRSAANRPLLRWLEDGPLVVVSDGPKSQPKLKARLVATGQQGTFGENGQRISVEVQETPSDSRELLASVDFEPGTDGQMESMLGFSQDLGFAGSVQSLAAISIRPDLEDAGSEGLQEAVMRSWETIHMGDEFEVQAGAEQVLARFSNGASGGVAASLPFASFAWKDGADSTVRYAFATALPRAGGESDAHATGWLPAMSVRNGALTIERGSHHELGWERRTGTTDLSLLVYADSLMNPVLEASSIAEARHRAWGGLYDPSSGIVRATGPGYSAAGLVAAIQRKLPGGTHANFTFANGEALALGSLRQSTLNEIAQSARPHRVATYSISLSGTIEGTGTHWRASYRWQPEDTVTRVAPYLAGAAEPYMNMHLRQRLGHSREGARSFDAMLDVSNVLDERGRSFVLSDGSLLTFAQGQRSLSAGLAFTF